MSEPVQGLCTLQRRRFLSTDPAMIDRFGDPFRPLEPECKVVQFDQPLTPAQLQQAGNLIAKRPDVQPYVYGRASRDLSFLRYFPALRRLDITLHELGDIGGFAYVARSLEELTFGRTKQTFSLRFLATMPQLRRLFLVRHKKDLPVIGGLSNLTGLGLSGITLADLSVLLPLTALRDLSIFLASTTNLALLPKLLALEDLFLMRITKLSDLSVLGDLVGLKTLRLDWMRNVTSLPNLAGLARLEDVTLDTMKGLTDLSPVGSGTGSPPAFHCGHAAAYRRKFSLLPGPSQSERTVGLHRKEPCERRRETCFPGYRTVKADSGVRGQESGIRRQESGRKGADDDHNGC